MHFFLCLFALITIILNVCTAVDQSCDASNQGTNPADYPRANLRRLTLKDGPDPGGTVGCPAPGDPNALDAKHSYDILFADGTHLNGTSEPNVVEVTVQGLTFPLHISCSDPFPNGYGMKGGPVEGVNPAVVEYRIWKYMGVGTSSCHLENECGDLFPSSAPTLAPTLLPTSSPTGCDRFLPIPGPCSDPWDVATDFCGNAYVNCLNTDDVVYKFDKEDASSTLTTFPQDCSNPRAVATDIYGNVYSMSIYPKQTV